MYLKMIWLQKVFETGLKQVERFQMVLRWVIGGWMDGCSPSAAFQSFKVVSKWFHSGFKHLFGGPVNPWIWEMTRTLRHQSRAGASSFPRLFEGCSFQEV